MSGAFEGAQALRRGVREIPDHPRPGVSFKDITPLLADAQLLRLAVAGLCEPAASLAHPVDVVAGIEARGFILAPPVALQLTAGFVPVRKKGKLPGPTVSRRYELEYGHAEIEMHADAVQPGQRVLLVDDVLATGGTAAAAVELIRQMGAQVVGLGVLIELASLGGRAQLPGIEVQSLLLY